MLLLDSDADPAKLPAGLDWERKMPSFFQMLLILLAAYAAGLGIGWLIWKK